MKKKKKKKSIKVRWRWIRGKNCVCVCLCVVSCTKKKNIQRWSRSVWCCKWSTIDDKREEIFLMRCLHNKTHFKALQTFLHLFAFKLWSTIAHVCTTNTRYKSMFTLLFYEIFWDVHVLMLWLHFGSFRICTKNIGSTWNMVIIYSRV